MEEPLVLLEPAPEVQAGKRAQHTESLPTIGRVLRINHSTRGVSATRPRADCSLSAALNGAADSLHYL